MRIARVYVPGVVHHVITRLVDRHFFFDLSGARETYLALLGRSLVRSNWSCLAYALMSNHIHLLLLAGEEVPERWLKRVHSPFGLRMNERVEGLGPIIADRPKMHIVPDDTVGGVLAYIHNNPVAAGVVTDAGASTWTSHRVYLGREQVPSWLDVVEGMRRCGFNGDAAGFDRWVKTQPSALDPALEGERLVRAARTPRPDGTRIATPIVGPSGYAPRVPFGSGRARPRPEAVVEAVSRVLGVRAAEARARSPKSIELRRIAVCSGIRLGCSIASVCSILGISKQHGSRLASKRTEDDELVLRIVTAQLTSGDEGDSVPIQVGGKTARIASRR